MQLPNGRERLDSETELIGHGGDGQLVQVRIGHLSVHPGHQQADQTPNSKNGQVKWQGIGSQAEQLPLSVG